MKNKCIDCGSTCVYKKYCKKCYMHHWHARKLQREPKNVFERIQSPPKKKNGEGCLRKDGYIILKIEGKRILQHTYVMSKKLGRPLMKNESVHHINGIRHDNRIENLELWTKSQPSGQRVKDKIEWCKEFLKLYDEM